jgi:hypothetical protein
MLSRSLIGIFLGSFFCFLFVVGRLPAFDEPQPEKLPLPKEASPELIEPEPMPPMPPMLFPPRRSSYAVWDFYGVGRDGHFRPLVIYSPYGAYYLYNGEPYPWVITHQTDFMPYVVD